MPTQSLIVYKTKNRPELMNWTCVVYGGSMFAVLVWWVLDARKWFKGPKVNIEHQLVAHDVPEMEGIDDGRSTESISGGEAKPTTSTKENVNVTEGKPPT